MSLVTIDPELRDWIIPLTSEEKSELEKSIIEDGCRDPLVTWNGIIVDGHHRYEICTRNNVEFKTVEKQFEDKNSVKIWMAKNQIARRNLDAIQRIALTKKAEPLIAEKAKMQQGQRTDILANLPKSSPIHTRDEMAKMARVSPRTYAKGKEVLDKATPEVVKKVMDGEVSIHKAYSDIHREENKLERQADLVNNPTMPDGKYNVILADPPWKYEFSETKAREIENQYPTMDLEQIKEMDLPIDDDAILLLWATAPKLEEALQVLNAWGFSYRTCAIWDKEKIGMGYWFRIQHELLLVGIKGQFKAPEPEDRFSSIIRSPRAEHSQKPEKIYDMIEAMFPFGKYLELFSRSERNGWVAWGNQILRKH